ncbi:hypothetical protein Mp_4g11230 [Marchantia polymorpha subsp. ruderalis]|uniref:Uncharacterized protein n=2 Tax=Marchantia polymorpha TaxID=3197 RepID=A0AAF6B8R0_MARPO|nr:hypothetical protein MARPO_0011s0108 [Marchantia polymorpha]BBN08394.1 hypothetical protein Mp_4g11230 [Marchantia polymorpha subsp. ruderalis]|eukprot:PTQ46430.1 hypothetical protein MARPO_0011s0108 [Marchantia polymorpha]
MFSKTTPLGLKIFVAVKSTHARSMKEKDQKKSYCFFVDVLCSCQTSRIRRMRISMRIRSKKYIFNCEKSLN